MEPVVKTELVFLTGDHRSFRGSRFLRARQLCRITQKRLDGLGVQVRTSSEPDEVSGAVVILNKSFLAVASAEQLSSLRARGNAVLADFIDHPVNPDLAQMVDGFLASSYTQERFLQAAFAKQPTFRVLHHADLRIEADCARGAQSRIGYFGQAYNGLHIEQLAADGLCDNVHAGRVEAAEWMARLPDYAIHYTVRAPQPFDGFKPFTKGAVAARCGALVLAQRDEESLLNLGADYPFLLSSTAYDDVRAAILRIRDSQDSPEWQAAHEAMRNLRVQCAPGRIARSVGRAFAAFR